MGNFLTLLFACVIQVPMTIIIFHLIPKIACHFDRPIPHGPNADERRRKLFEYLGNLPFPVKLKTHLIQQINVSGIGDPNAWIVLTGAMAVLPVMVFLFMTIRKYSLVTSLALGAISVVLPNIYLSGKIEKRNKAFVNNAYKLYYFLHSQISSGIKVTDAVKGLHEIADHPLIQKTFVQFVAKYELTLDIEDSLQILRKSFSGYDCEMLCVSIQQCVNTGMAGKTLLKMEQMMFAKYFCHLQKDTEKFKTRLLLSGIFTIVPLVMLFLLPVLYDAFRAFEKIMQTS